MCMKKKDAGRESLWALSTVNGQYFALRITNSSLEESEGNI